MKLAVQQADKASAEFRIERIKQVAAVKDRSGDYCDWRYLCEVVRVADGSEARILSNPTISKYQSPPKDPNIAHHVTVRSWHACHAASWHPSCRQRSWFCRLL